MEPAARWEGLHYNPSGKGCPCTCVATQGDDLVVSSGEDGRVNVINVARSAPLRTIGEYGDYLCLYIELFDCVNTEFLVVIFYTRDKVFVVLARWIST